MEKNLLVRPQESKLDATLNSRNFWVSIVSLLLLALAGNGADVLNPEGVSGEIYDAVVEGQIGTLLSVLFINFINPVIKIVREKKWNWEFTKSLNFWVQFATVGLIALTATGITFPEGAAADLVNSIFGGNFETIMVTIVVNIINPVYHWFFDRKKDQKLIESNQNII